MKQAVIDRLTELHQKFGGFSVEEIITEARNPKSPLHGEYEWDKDKAHEFYLRERTKALIRAWYVWHETGNQELVRVRGAVSILTRDDTTGKRSRRYWPIQDVLTNKTMRESMLEDALRELQAFKMKYQHLVELSGVFAAIDALASKPRGQGGGQRRAKETA